MEYKVIRLTYGAHFTRGLWIANGVQEGFTLEDTTRKKGIFVYGKTAIPACRVELKNLMSPRFKKMLPRLMIVPDRGILVHGGNTAEDSLGCILIGRTLVGTDRIAGNFTDIVVAQIKADAEKNIKSYIEIIDTHPYFVT